MRFVLPALLLLLLVGCGGKAETVRFATFNSALSKDQPGELLATMQTGDDPQAKAVAAVIQAARPDVLLLQEFDHGGEYDPDGQALRLFQQNYLAVPQQDGLEPITYEHVYLAPSNTGIPTGVDLNNDGLIAPTEGAEVGSEAYAADCHGYGRFPGQYAFVILSKYPIDREGIRTFNEYRWRSLPDGYIDRVHYPFNVFSPRATAVLRLSSKNHAEVPVDVSSEAIHVLAAHPTPPVFDGPEDRNGLRNYDEIGLLALQMNHPTDAADAVNADKIDLYATNEMVYYTPWWRRLLFFMPGPMKLYRFDPVPVVLMGDLNADSHDGDSRPGAMQQLLGHKRINADVTPTSFGGVAAAQRQGGVNADHQTNPATDTADWSDQGRNASGNLRVDYVLPSRDLTVTGSGVFWPTPEEPLMGVDLATVERASDHRLVWVDVEVD